MNSLTCLILKDITVFAVKFQMHDRWLFDLFFQDKSFGTAGSVVVIEELLEGEEVSVSGLGFFNIYSTFYMFNVYTFYDW